MEGGRNAGSPAAGLLRSRILGLCGGTLYSLTLELQQVSPLPLSLLCDPGQVCALC